MSTKFRLVKRVTLQTLNFVLEYAFGYGNNESHLHYRLLQTDIAVPILNQKYKPH